MNAIQKRGINKNSVKMLVSDEVMANNIIKKFSDNDMTNTRVDYDFLDDNVVFNHNSAYAV